MKKYWLVILALALCAAVMLCASACKKENEDGVGDETSGKVTATDTSDTLDSTVDDDGNKKPSVNGDSGNSGDSGDDGEEESDHYAETLPEGYGHVFTWEDLEAD